MKKFILAVCLFLLMLAAPVIAQSPAWPASHTTLTLDGSVGGGSIGYNPDLNLGGSITLSVTRRLELYTQLTASPITKTGYYGATAVGDGRAIFWAAPKVALFVGVRPSYVYFGGVQKHAFNGMAGVVIRDHWNPNMPGRLYVAYEQEIGGCVWATAANPCPITSAKFIGARVEQEFRMNSHLRVGIAAAMGRVNAQINPYAPQAGAIYGFGGQFDMTFRFTLKKQSTDSY